MKKTNEEVKELKEESVVPVKKKTTSKAKTSTTKTTAKKAASKTTTKKTTTKKAEPKAKTETKVTAKKSTAKSSTAAAEKKATTKKTTTKKAEPKAKTETKVTAKKSTAKSSTTAAEKKATTKKTATKKAEPKAKTETKVTAKKSTAKSSTTAAEKKATTKKTATKKAEPKASSTKTTSTKIIKKSSKTISVKADNVEIIPESLKEILRSNDSVFKAEYYDLPYRYNETTIKILAQSPHSLFLYWDVSDNDRNSFLRKYGENFFNETKPVLLVHNKTQNYSFEVEVDDFTNSWYLRTPTSDCVFDIELARKDVSQLKKYSFQSPDNRLHVSESNIMNSPNDHIMIETLSEPITFKNIKTNELEKKTILNADTLKEYYKDFEVSNEVFNNPSSNFRI